MNVAGPRHEEQAVHHEHLAVSIDRQQRQAAEMRASTPEP